MKTYNDLWKLKFTTEFTFYFVNVKGSTTDGKLTPASI